MQESKSLGLDLNPARCTACNCSCSSAATGQACSCSTKDARYLAHARPSWQRFYNLLKGQHDMAATLHGSEMKLRCCLLRSARALCLSETALQSPTCICAISVAITMALLVRYCCCLKSLLWAMAYGHSSRLPLLEAPIVIAEKCKMFLSYSFLKVAVVICRCACRGASSRRGLLPSG